MNVRRIWSGLSGAGVAAIADPELARKITLCNQIAASIAVVMLVAGLVRWWRAFADMCPNRYSADPELAP